jgi:hypothetical protein
MSKPAEPPAYEVPKQPAEPGKSEPAIEVPKIDAPKEMDVAVAKETL